MTHETGRLSELASAFDIVLCDVWGVIHNGVEAWPTACDALATFRQGGGTVILITNAPRPSESVQAQLDRLHVPRSAYDGIVSSGDVTRETIAAHPGARLWHLGPDRDKPIFDGLTVTFASLEEANYIVCTGLFDDTTEIPEDYRGRLEVARKRDLMMVCANPDLAVERGSQLVYCAGALGELYREIGGDVIFAGKPHLPIYEDAAQLAATIRGAPTDRSRILAIGDSLRTDLEGAGRFGIDFLFVTGGLHAAELGDRNNPDANALKRLLGRSDHAPRAITHQLAW